MNVTAVVLLSLVVAPAAFAFTTEQYLWGTTSAAGVRLLVVEQLEDEQNLEAGRQRVRVLVRRERRSVVLAA